MELTSESQEQLDIAEEKKNLKKVEAALFISARYLSIQELVELTDINPLLLKELLEKLGDYYQKIDSSIEILNKEDLWKMDIKQEYFDMINKLATGKAEFTKAEQETLAIIAYKQPVKQSVIIKIRGNKAYDHVKHFTDIGLVKAKKAGHTNELSLSESFYDYFHLEKKNKNNNSAVSSSVVADS
jgi:segregation and condensation protein B